MEFDEGDAHDYVVAGIVDSAVLIITTVRQETFTI